MVLSHRIQRRAHGSIVRTSGRHPARDLIGRRGTTEFVEPESMQVHVNNGPAILGNARTSKQCCEE